MQLILLEVWWYVFLALTHWYVRSVILVVGCRCPNTIGVWFNAVPITKICTVFYCRTKTLVIKKCDMAFIEPMHHDKPNITCLQYSVYIKFKCVPYGSRAPFWKYLMWTLYQIGISEFHCRLDHNMGTRVVSHYHVVMPYGIKHFGQHWFS